MNSVTSNSWHISKISHAAHGGLYQLTTNIRRISDSGEEQIDIRVVIENAASMTGEAAHKAALERAREIIALALGDAGRS